MASSQLPVIVICGPTASGKSALARKMAQAFSGEIISADSRQIYGQLTIGTDRITADQMDGIPHHLTGHVELGQRYTAFDFVRDAEKLVLEIGQRDHLPIICGGTGLYIRALVDGLVEIPEADMRYRQELIDLTAENGPSHVFAMLKEIDPDEASRIHPQNTIKIIRALEMFHITGRTKTQLMADTRPPNEHIDFLQIILWPDRELLYKKIEQRVDKMISSGLLAEVEVILRSPSGTPLKEAKVVGYAELIDYLEDRLTLDEAIGLIKQNTRRYAKRQFTWFRGIAPGRVLHGFGGEVADSCRTLIETFLA